MKVKYLDFGKIWTGYPEAQDAFHQALENGEMILRGELEEFEKKFAKYTGTKYAVGVNSGTDALFLTLKALGIGKGDEVITVAHTFVATIQVIDNVGATPVLVDVGEDGLINISQVINSITEKTKAIIPVHLAGDYVKMYDGFVEEMANRGIIVVEDAAQALGATSPKYVGCYSFYPAKILGGIGDGGAIVTNDEKLYEELLKLRNHYNIGKATMGEGKAFAQSEKYKFGYNSRLDNANAAFLSKKLDKLDMDIFERQAIALEYDEAFRDLPIKLPVKRKVYQDYIIQTDKRDELYQFLKEESIETLGADQLSPHHFPGLGLDHYNLPVTDKFFAQSLRLPCNQFMTTKDVEYVISKVKEFYGKNTM